MLFAGYSYTKEIKSLIGALMMCLTSYFLYPLNSLIEFFAFKQKSKLFAVSWKYSKLLVLPVLVFLVFYGIYAFSNPTFNSYSVQFWNWVRDKLSFFLDYYPFERFIFIFLGLILIAGILYNSKVKIFGRIEKKFVDKLFRDKGGKLYHGQFDLKKTIKNHLPYLFTFKNQSLKNEYKVGVVLMVMVNLLLMILNIIDINFVWLNFNTSEVDNLAFFVHEGTYYLIFSIILSSLIILYYFRGNLNFYSKNKILKFIACFWIFQNGILAVSLALRNYYYISYYYALSFKRIGVMIFLVLAFSGLFSMLIKITFKKTLFYLIKLNSWVLFGVLLLLSSVNWDYQIAVYNLQNPQKDKVDYGYLFTLNDDVIPLLYDNREYLDKEFIIYRSWGRGMTINGGEYLNERISSFLINYNKHSFLSWNFTDSKTFNKLKGTVSKLSIN
jgi:hypothetical protein